MEKKYNKKEKIRVAFAGNPNVGKSTLFNALTGAHQHIGNWPGKTVELAFGKITYKNIEFELVDLPGTYSLSGFTDEEIVARDFIVKEKPDVVVVVTSATTLSRNMYLVIQVLELTNNVVVAVNMIDEARNAGLKIDFRGLSKALNIPFVPISALYKEGIDDLLNAILSVAQGKFKAYQIKYDLELERLLSELELIIDGKIKEYPPRWVAIRLLERDRYIVDLLTLKIPEAIVKAREIHDRIHEFFKKDPPLLIINERYKIVDELIEKYVSKKTLTNALTEKIDTIVLHPIFQFVTTAITFIVLFWVVFFIGDFFVEYIDLLFSLLTESAESYLVGLNINPIIISFIVSDSGLIGATATLVSFIPYILLFYFAFTILENSGLMARLAFSMDKILRYFGFSGKSFFPITLSLGCNVVGIQSIRIIEDKKIKAILYIMNSFVPCSARIGVMAILIGVFIPDPLTSSIAIFLILINSFFIIFIESKILSHYLKVEASSFVIELPPYRFPPLKSVFNISWIRTKMFLYRAGVLIFIGTLLIWAGINIPPGAPLEESLLGRIGILLQPIAMPLGLDWRAVLALILGFLAKENTLAVLQALYGGLESLPLYFDLPKAIAFIIFYTYYVPCLATVATIKKESNSWLITTFAVALSIITAYLVAFLVYVLLSVMI
ncbi:MAG: ferrous iron transport protein B [Candidatus Asgardarchaeum sp.]